MKLVTYIIKDTELTVSTFGEPAGGRVGWIEGDYVVDIGFAQEWAALEQGVPISRVLPLSMRELLEAGEEGMSELSRTVDAVSGRDPAALKVEGEPVALSLAEVRLAAPLPNPRSFRDFYAFEQHVKTARARRGLDMVPEWYEFPAFYFSNPHSILGPDEEVVRPRDTRALDYELEIACVIGREGRDIPAEKAGDYIIGFMILNDWSARDLQAREMKVGLGPAKGKDFATSVGPWLVTKDELESRRQNDRWDLTMTARVNGRELSRGNTVDLTFSFADMVERASRDCTLYPGDLIGSGTVGTGCILELGTKVHPWLEPGDTVELSIDGLGVLRNRVAERSPAAGLGKKTI
ncbi:fumarylacetoacetate hydrolase family protein [Salinithrix halophila]|uniref:Fumarylacetoacetate hydrolase family protein n=1 Tax=Salinithrix halophila TaxID=1485204 RepID=A0ABV8JEB1_9BACL